MALHRCIVSLRTLSHGDNTGPCIEEDLLNTQKRARRPYAHQKTKHPCLPFGHLPSLTLPSKRRYLFPPPSPYRQVFPVRLARNYDPYLGLISQINASRGRSVRTRARRRASKQNAVRNEINLASLLYYVRFTGDGGGYQNPPFHRARYSTSPPPSPLPSLPHKMHHHSGDAAAAVLRV